MWKNGQKLCQFSKKIIFWIFSTQCFATNLDTNGNVIFLGGDKVSFEKNNIFIYNSKNNKLTLSIKGTNDNMTVASSHRLNEIKEIASFDKDEQSLIKLSIEISKFENEYNYQYRDYRQTYNTKTYGLL